MDEKIYRFTLNFILVNKKGEVANLNAPRPSSGEELYKLIDELLDE